MISVEEAKKLVDQNSHNLDEIMVSISKAESHVLSQDLFANLSLPSFNQSAMDGYLVHADHDIKEGETFSVSDEIKAGDTNFPVVKKGEAIRIFTGALVPDTGNTVIIQEHVAREGNEIKITRDLKKGINIRKKGEQIQKGALALKKGTLINPGGISFMASLGFEKIPVFRKPNLGILLTGNELIEPGKRLEDGQIYESNSFALQSAAEKHQFTVNKVSKVEDDFLATKSQISEMFEQSDVLLISGGISVGDYDFVAKALLELNIKQVFHKVRQKPGKPLFFGKSESKYVFALPGNPASALVCFYQYVLPALHKMQGKLFKGLDEFEIELKETYNKKGNRAEFLKSKITNGKLEILEGQLSHMMHTFAISEGLAFIPENIDTYQENDVVKWYKF